MTEETIQYLPLAKIATDDNIRKVISKEELHGLMESFRAVGQLQPIRVRLVGSVFKTTDGARRVLAAREAGWERIAAIVECDDGGAAAAKQRSLIANCQRTDWTSMETAEAVSDLMNSTGWNASDTAIQLGFSAAKVSRLLALLTLPETIQEEIRDGRIPASSGVELSRIEDPARQAAFAGEIAAGRMTRDGVSGAAKAARNNSCQTNSGTVSRATVVLGDGRSVSVLGQSLTLESVIQIIETLLSLARVARKKGWTLPTFLKVLRETKA